MTSQEHADRKGPHEGRMRAQRERIVAHLLDELEEDEARVFEEELATSPELAAERARLAATVDLVRSALGGGEALSAAGLESLLRKAATPAAAPWYRRPLWRMAAGLLVLVGAVALGARVLREERQRRLGADETVSVAFLSGDPSGEAPPVDSGERLASEVALSRADSKDGKAFNAQTVHQTAAEAGSGEHDTFLGAVASGGGGMVVEETAVPEGLSSLGYSSPGPDARAPRPTESAAVGATGAPALKGKRYRGPGDATPPGPAPAKGGGGSGPASPAPSTPPVRVEGGAMVPAPATVPGAVAAEGLDDLAPPAYAGRRAVGPAASPPAEEPAGEEEVELGTRFDFDLERSADSREFLKMISPLARQRLIERRLERILRECRRRPGERPRDMFFRFWGDNPFVWTQLDPLSTFSVDVDTASYALARRYLAEGYLPEKAQVRTEEFVNYFDPDVPPPSEGTFRIHTDLTPTPFGNPSGERWTLRVVVRGKEVSRLERDPLALTFVVDVSGSMKEQQRLELVKHGLRLLLSELDARDTIGIVAFSNEARVVLPPTSAANRGLIESALYGLQANGGTNAEAGLLMGYEMALTSLDRAHTSRVVLLSDGVANIGQIDQDRINETVRQRREQGIFLNTIGVGMNNHNDVFLEQLADKGDGVCNYIDGPREARRALVENFTGAFQPIARDVKIQVEFDPGAVVRYRLLGYENRAIADADFRNDAVDAGEVGAGHQVVALYQLELGTPAPEGPLATVRLRWKPPTGAGRDPLEDAAAEIAQPVLFSSATSWEGASPGYQRSVIVGQFAEILRRSVHARDVSLDELIAAARRVAPALADPEFEELIALMERSRALILERRSQPSEYERCLDLLRRNSIRRAECERLGGERRDEVLSRLEEENRRLEAQLRELLREKLLDTDGPGQRR